MSEKIWYTYDEIHQAIRELAHKIQAAGIPYDAMIAIGGGGFIPARILRSFLNIPIYAITTAYYYNDQGHTTRNRVQKIQWLDPMPENLKGKHVLIVDEVDDSRVTLQFCLEQLQQEEFASMGVAVLHEKIKRKAGILPPDIAYFSGLVTPDWWINYPWDADDINEHNALAAQRQLPPQQTTQNTRSQHST